MKRKTGIQYHSLFRSALAFAFILCSITLSAQVTDTITRELMWERLDPSSAVINYREIPVEANPWNSISLTGQRFKSSMIQARVKGKFPIWIPVAAGVAGGGAAAYFLLKDDDPTGPNAVNDQFTIPCGTPANVNVLQNDSGDNISISAIGNTTSVQISDIGNGILQLINVGSQNFSFNYTILDSDGRTSTATVQITIQLNPIIAGDDSFNAAQGASLTGNLLINDSGDGITITSNTQPSTGTLELSSDGTFSYTPEPGFSGLLTFTYTITDNCGQTAQATVTIEVELPPCNLEADFTVESATCGLEDGSASIDITPSGTYVYNWSNGSVGQTISNIEGGEYSVTVTDQQEQCSQVFQVDVPSESVDYLIDSETFPGSCDEDGNIALELQSPLGGPFVISGTGPSGSFEFTSASSSVSFEDFISTPPGVYNVEVFDQTMGESCSRNYVFTIEDESPDLMLSPDSYNTSNSSDLSGNVFDNDIGVDLQVSSNTIPTSGTLVINPDGSFTYTPETGFSGTVTFNYTATDACGRSAESTVTIVITDVDCSFNVVLEFLNPGCNMSDGIITANPMPPGNYTYLWSNGSNDSSIENIPAGSYSVTVTSIDLNCEKIFSQSLIEEKEDHIKNVTTSSATCEGGGNISVTLTNSNGGPLILDLISEENQEQFQLSPGVIQLGTLTTIFPGQYTIIVYDPEAGPNCADSVSVEVVDNSAFPQAVNDTFTINTGTSLEANILLNDSGEEIEVTNNTLPASGILILDSDGAMKYDPAPGFEGQVQFSYEITNKCGKKDTAIVVINIEDTGCAFGVSFVRQLPHCGLEDGSIFASVVPAGNYAFLWSTGATTSTITNIGAGSYMLTVTNQDNGCNAFYTVDLQSLPPTYLTIVKIEPGNCLGEGDILINLETIGAGPFQLHLQGGNVSENLSLGGGEHSLNDYANLPSGNYEITVFDVSIGSECTQNIQVTIPDNTEDLMAVDDFYDAAYETPVSGVVIENDEGFSIQVTTYFEVENGTLTEMNTDGSFTFLPADGFSGTASFRYIILDACGDTDEGLVTIEVAEETCNFFLTFNTTPATCGIANGSTQATVSEPGFYFFQWSNGMTGPNLFNVQAGMYSVTVTDLELICSLSFGVEIPSTAPQYASNINVTQPNCNGPGNIQFTLSSPSGGPYNLQIEYPNGIENVVAPSGPNSLSDYIDIVVGNYTILIHDQNVDSNCIDTVQVVINPEIQLTIDLLNVLPPSTEESEDGVITIGILTQTQGPYTILLNENPVGQTNNSEFNINNLPAGVYTVQLIDNNGCTSNIIEVGLMPTEPPFEFGASFGPAGLYNNLLSSLPELPYWLTAEPGQIHYGYGVYGLLEPLNRLDKFQIQAGINRGAFQSSTGKTEFLNMNIAVLTGFEGDFSLGEWSLVAGPLMSYMHFSEARGNKSLNFSDNGWMIKGELELDLLERIHVVAGAEALYFHKIIPGAYIQCNIPFTR